MRHNIFRQLFLIIIITIYGFKSSGQTIVEAICSNKNNWVVDVNLCELKVGDLLTLKETEGKGFRFKQKNKFKCSLKNQKNIKFCGTEKQDKVKMTIKLKHRKGVGVKMIISIDRKKLILQGDKETFSYRVIQIK